MDRDLIPNRVGFIWVKLIGRELKGQRLGFLVTFSYSPLSFSSSANRYGDLDSDLRSIFAALAVWIPAREEDT